MSDVNYQVNLAVDKRVHQAMQVLLDNADFRLVLGTLLIRSGLERSDFGKGVTTDYLEGRRSMGLELLRLCDSVTYNGDPLYGFRKRTQSMLEYKEMEQYYYELSKEK